MRRFSMLLLMIGGLVLGACGGDGDDKKAPESYATDVCAAAQEWVNGIQSGAQELRGLASGTTPRQGRQALQGFFGDAVSDTEKFSKDLDSAGTPDTDDGEKAADALKDAVAQSKGILERARAQTAELPVNNAQAFGTEARKVGNSTRDSLSRVGDAITAPRSGELQKAFSNAEGCRNLSTAGPR